MRMVNSEIWNGAKQISTSRLDLETRGKLLVGGSLQLQAIETFFPKHFSRKTSEHRHQQRSSYSLAIFI
jgi:hypothetical protein